MKGSAGDGNRTRDLRIALEKGLLIPLYPMSPTLHQAEPPRHLNEFEENVYSSAFSAGAIVATFLVLSGVVQVLVVQGRLRDPFRYVALLDPYALLDGLATTMFGGAGRNTTVTHSGLDPAIFAAGAVVVAVATLLVLVLRYRRIEA